METDEKPASSTPTEDSSSNGEDEGLGTDSDEQQSLQQQLVKSSPSNSNAATTSAIDVPSNTKLTMNDLDRQIEILMKCEVLSEPEVKVLCAKAREILCQEGNVQYIDPPVTVCGKWFLF